MYLGFLSSTCAPAHLYSMRHTLGFYLLLLINLYLNYYCVPCLIFCLRHQETEALKPAQVYQPFPRSFCLLSSHQILCKQNISVIFIKAFKGLQIFSPEFVS